MPYALFKTQRTFLIFPTIRRNRRIKRTPMERIYEYRTFQVAIELETVWSSSKSVTLSPPRGYIALIRISTEFERAATIVTQRLTAEGSKPFSTEANAFMAGYSKAQRMIDYVFLQ